MASSREFFNRASSGEFFLCFDATKTWWPIRKVFEQRGLKVIHKCSHGCRPLRDLWTEVTLSRIKKPTKKLTTPDEAEHLSSSAEFFFVFWVRITHGLFFAIHLFFAIYLSIYLSMDFRTQIISDITDSADPLCPRRLILRTKRWRKLMNNNREIISKRFAIMPSLLPLQCRFLF